MFTGSNDVIQTEICKMIYNSDKEIQHNYDFNTIHPCLISEYFYKLSSYSRYYMILIPNKRF